MKTCEELQERANAANAELLLTDTEIAMTFLDLADTTRIAENRARRRKAAAEAYVTIRNFMPRVEMSAQQRATLEMRLEKIRRRLAKPG